MEFKKIQSIISALGVGVISLLFLWMIYPYLFAIFWAAVIATIFYPLYRYLVRIFRHEKICAALTVLIVVLIVLAPLSAMLGLVIQQAIGLYTKLTNPETLSSVQSTVAAILAKPAVQELLGDVQIEKKLQGLSSNTATIGLQWLKVGSQSTITAIIHIFIMIYALYYFFRDGEKWLQRLMHLAPLGDKNEKILYEKFVSAAKATLKGTLLIGLIQGTIGGLLFFVVGIPAAAFWGLVMTIFSIIPAVGPFMVMVPAALYLLLTGQIWSGVIVLTGCGLVSILDNLLRPPLVGKDIQIHPIMILFATIGGIGLFGISGVVMGPIIASLFLAIISIYEQRFKKQLDSSKT